jgi:hypothetical protein
LEENLGEEPTSRSCKKLSKTCVKKLQKAVKDLRQEAAKSCIKKLSKSCIKKLQRTRGLILKAHPGDYPWWTIAGDLG